MLRYSKLRYSMFLRAMLQHSMLHYIHSMLQFSIVLYVTVSVSNIWYRYHVHPLHRYQALTFHRYLIGGSGIGSSLSSSHRYRISISPVFLQYAISIHPIRVYLCDRSPSGYCERRRKGLPPLSIARSGAESRVPGARCQVRGCWVPGAT